MTAKSYDEFPYESHSFPLSHSDNLATIALLKGLEPAPVEHCRVLELGCGEGGNLVPMAHGLPESQFVGIDLSERHIRAGQDMAAALGLTNLVLRAMDIMEAGPELGTFDYIICHGVYSWVPPPVRDKILGVCAENLALNGVAYVSYNTYPGWFLRGAVAEMMNLHSRRFEAPAERAAQARALLEFLAEFTPSAQSPFAALLREERDRVRQVADSHVFHEQLADVNRPVYFYQFNEHANAHGLEYLAEAWLPDMSPLRFNEKARQALPKMSADPIDQEQYMDFLVGRPFRQTLLCHQGVFRNQVIDEGVVARFHVASPARPDKPETDLKAAETEEFATPQGTRLSLRQPIARAALRCLAEWWPQAVSFHQLLHEARARVGGPEEAGDERTLAETLFRCCHWGLVELHLHWPRFTLEVSDRPVAHPVARYQAEHGNRVTNVLHQTLAIDPVERIILPALNGQADRVMLANDLRRLATDGKLKLKSGTPADALGALPAALETCLRRFARAGLLVS